MLNRAIISLGSNKDREMNIRRATELLLQYFPSICFSEAVYTEPVACPLSSSFLNRMALVDTPLSADDLKLVFKQIEVTIGRKPDDKKQGIVPIDIDLLQWNDRVLKPEDMQREYVISLLAAM
ncbi:2-amino-4-hydroxy-6-hydroxymethyldihydropteridinediphosphokinase [Parabacteroides chinchillae]|uniref:2-amino-4-hydroxy-6-hydroxymethyldihydropteridine pyrophosphokinase n=2 Tax=Parabacteroides chinchillae TaxID=871327 RepID=A0A8G2BTX7_9BACT|nr:2-amino-4-hydroxy-6-hydroxymethyldihydropteridinediphosphokinase [Parabacteroides chinchillae]